MPRPIQLKDVLKALKKQGFFFVSQKGSHAKFRNYGTPSRTVIVKTTKKEIPHGTLQSIVLQSGIKEIEFRNKKT